MMPVTLFFQDSRVIPHVCESHEIAAAVQMDISERCKRLNPPCSDVATEVTSDRMLVTFDSLLPFRPKTITVLGTLVYFSAVHFDLLRERVAAAFEKGPREGGYYKIHGGAMAYCVSPETLKTIRVFIEEIQLVTLLAIQQEEKERIRAEKISDGIEKLP